MKLLNLGCGEVLPGEPWINADYRCDRTDRPSNVVIFNMRESVWPLEDEEFDGIMAWHIFEHFDAVELQDILCQCHRILKPGGVMRVGVPDASHSRSYRDVDCKMYAKEVFGEENSHPDFKTFMGWALFLYREHKQIFTEDALWCTLVNDELPRNGSGFKPENVYRVHPNTTARPGHYCSSKLLQLENRRAFSLIMECYK